MLREHWSDIDRVPSYRTSDDTLADDTYRHAARNDDWENAEILERAGFLTCSQARLFQFLEDLLHPLRRDQAEQEQSALAGTP